MTSASVFCGRDRPADGAGMELVEATIGVEGGEGRPCKVRSRGSGDKVTYRALTPDIDSVSSVSSPLSLKETVRIGFEQRLHAYYDRPPNRRPLQRKEAEFHFNLRSAIAREARRKLEWL